MDHNSGMTASTQSENTPELLSPAGDWQCVRAAVENGADAVYFGLDCGFNARYRAQNFGLPDLEELASCLHRRSVKGYSTLNTLVFLKSYPSLQRLSRRLRQLGSMPYSCKILESLDWFAYLP